MMNICYPKECLNSNPAPAGWPGRRPQNSFVHIQKLQLLAIATKVRRSPMAARIYGLVAVKKYLHKSVQSS